MKGKAINRNRRRRSSLKSSITSVQEWIRKCKASWQLSDEFIALHGHSSLSFRLVREVMHAMWIRTQRIMLRVKRNSLQLYLASWQLSDEFIALYGHLSLSFRPPGPYNTTKDDSGCPRGGEVLWKRKVLCPEARRGAINILKQASSGRGKQSRFQLPSAFASDIKEKDVSHSIACSISRPSKNP